MSPLIKNIALAAGLALVLWLGYILFLKNDTPLVSEDPTLTAAIRDGQEFLSQIQELDQTSLDGAILNDARFESLSDFTVEPQSEESGRDNPFAPIGTDPADEE